MAVLQATAFDRLVITPLDRAFHSDILPTLRSIVAFEDTQEIAFQEADAREQEECIYDARIRRSKRLAISGKERYARYLNIEGELAECVRKSGFNSSR